MSTTLSRAQPAVAVFVLAQLRALSGEARDLERGELLTLEGALDGLEHRADQILDCAGGPTHAWPEEWLG